MAMERCQPSTVRGADTRGQKEKPTMKKELNEAFRCATLCDERKQRVAKSDEYSSMESTVWQPCD